MSDQYHGALVNGKMHGNGYWLRADGTVFFGRFEDGVFVQGVRVDPNGHCCAGKFKDGEPDGKALFVQGCRSMVTEKDRVSQKFIGPCLELPGDDNTSHAFMFDANTGQPHTARHSVNLVTGHSMAEDVRRPEHRHLFSMESGVSRVGHFRAGDLLAVGRIHTFKPTGESTVVEFDAAGRPRSDALHHVVSAAGGSVVTRMSADTAQPIGMCLQTHADHSVTVSEFDGVQASPVRTVLNMDLRPSPAPGHPVQRPLLQAIRMPSPPNAATPVPIPAPILRDGSGARSSEVSPASGVTLPPSAITRPVAPARPGIPLNRNQADDKRSAAAPCEPVAVSLAPASASSATSTPFVASRPAVAFSSPFSFSFSSAPSAAPSPSSVSAASAAHCPPSRPTLVQPLCSSASGGVGGETKQPSKSVKKRNVPPSLTLLPEDREIAMWDDSDTEDEDEFHGSVVQPPPSQRPPRVEKRQKLNYDVDVPIESLVPHYGPLKVKSFNITKSGLLKLVFQSFDKKFGSATEIPLQAVVAEVTVDDHHVMLHMQSERLPLLLQFPIALCPVASSTLCCFKQDLHNHFRAEDVVDEEHTVEGLLHIWQYDRVQILWPQKCTTVQSILDVEKETWFAVEKSKLLARQREAISRCKVGAISTDIKLFHPIKPIEG